LSRYFASLAQIDGAFRQWYETGWSRKAALKKQIDATNTEYVRRLLERGRNRRDVDKTVIDSLGYYVHIWNGQRGGQVSGLAVRGRISFGRAAVSDSPA
jgi:hypothetical protein